MAEKHCCCVLLWTVPDVQFLQNANNANDACQKCELPDHSAWYRPQACGRGSGRHIAYQLSSTALPKSSSLMIRLTAAFAAHMLFMFIRQSAGTVAVAYSVSLLRASIGTLTMQEQHTCAGALATGMDREYQKAVLLTSICQEVPPDCDRTLPYSSYACTGAP